MSELLGRFGDFHTYPPLRTRTVAGASAGNVTVTGIKVGDTLVAVQRVNTAGADLSDEFTITAANTINNTGGTATTGMTLLVIWYSADSGLAP